MRGAEPKQPLLFYVDSLEDWVRADHPLRSIRTLVDEALAGLSGHFDAMYSEHGRPSIPPEQLLRAMVLQMLFTIRSERQLVEDVHNNLLYRWFVGLELNQAVWDRATFSKNRERLLEAEARKRGVRDAELRSRAELVRAIFQHDYGTRQSLRNARRFVTTLIDTANAVLPLFGTHAPTQERPRMQPVPSRNPLPAQVAPAP